MDTIHKQENGSKAAEQVATGITQASGLKAPKEASTHRKLVESGAKELGRMVTG